MARWMEHGRLSAIRPMARAQWREPARVAAAVLLCMCCGVERALDRIERQG